MLRFILPITFFVLSLSALFVTPVRAADPWVVYQGAMGELKGKNIVLVSGDEEYRSEEVLPQLGKILAEHHGCKCTVLFAIDSKDGAISPNTTDNIPGLDALDGADLMIIMTRFRNLPEGQMKHIVDYVDSGRPIIGLRTATHAFAGMKAYAKYNYNSKDWSGGFGRQVLGETWVNHHGGHGRQSTRGLLVEERKDSPILRGLKNGDVWGTTDVYTVHLPLPETCQPLVMGQVLEGMKFDDQPLDEKDTPAGKRKNDPMMPVAWTNSFKSVSGKTARVFTTTMGSADDFATPGTRRLLVNATYWALGLEDKITDKLNIDLVGEYKPHPFGNNKYTPGVKPEDLKMIK